MTLGLKTILRGEGSIVVECVPFYRGVVGREVWFPLRGGATIYCPHIVRL